MRLYVLALFGLVACRSTLPASWRVLNGDSATAAEDGKRVLRLQPKGGNRKGSNVALALADGVDFGEGTIEVDVRGSGAAQASFLGIAFHVAGDDAYEAVYFRPFNFQAEDALHRGHAVQYIAWPEHTWERLRTRAPGVYESAVAPVPDPARWFHARIEVAARQVSVFVDKSDKPCLVVERLGATARGGVGLWVDSQPGSFANLTIRPTK